MKYGFVKIRPPQQEVRISAYLVGDHWQRRERPRNRGTVFRGNPLLLGLPAGGRTLAHGYVRVDTS